MWVQLHYTKINGLSEKCKHFECKFFGSDITKMLQDNFLQYFCERFN